MHESPNLLPHALLSKVLKRSGSVARLQQLLAQATEAGVEVKEAVREDVAQWIAKRLPPQ